MKKRFIELDDGLDFTIKDIESGEMFYDCDSVVDLLNKLHLRNKRLEGKIQRERKLYVKQHLRWSKEAETKIKELSEENEQLKSREHDLALELNTLVDENEQLKQYKQAVSDVLRSWSQKNLTAKQLQVVIAIMEELNVMGELE